MNREYLNIEGQVVDKVSAFQIEVQTAIEFVQSKLETQQTEVEKSQVENTELLAVLKQEKEKQLKLLKIATEKYKINVAELEAYLPKGKEYYEKLATVEKRLIEQTKAERNDLRNNYRSKSLVLDVTKRQLLTKADKIEQLKLKLKQKARAAQALIEKGYKLD